MDNAMTSDDMKACRFVLNLEKKKKKRNKNTALARIRTQNLRQKEKNFCIAPFIADALSSRPRRQLLPVGTNQAL